MKRACRPAVYKSTMSVLVGMDQSGGADEDGVCKPKSTLPAMAYFKDTTRDIDEDTTREELNGVYFNRFLRSATRTGRKILVRMQGKVWGVVQTPFSKIK